ncbi:hypothetical protein ACVWWG_007632 [Bradyrhizobium sp. LB7.2]
MPMYFVSASIRGVPVMCNTIEAKSVSAALEFWRNEFADAPGKLRAELPDFDDMNRKFAEQLLEGMDQHRADAAIYGVEFKARPSRAKEAA